MSLINLIEKENKESEERIKENAKRVEKLHNDFKRACG